MSTFLNCRDITYIYCYFFRSCLLLVKKNNKKQNKNKSLILILYSVSSKINVDVLVTTDFWTVDCTFSTLPLQVYTGSGDCTIRSYDAKSGDVKKVFIGHDFAVTALEVTTAYVAKSMLANIHVWRMLMMHECWPQAC